VVTRTLLRALLLALTVIGFAACTSQPSKVSQPPTPVAGAPSSVPSGLVTPQELAAQPGGIETVRIAYSLLLAKYYKPLKPDDLLSAAWGGVLQELGRQGNTNNGAAPKLTGDPTADFALFSQAFNAIVPTTDQAKYAFAAVEAMTHSLDDDHTSFLSADQYKRFGLGGASNAPGKVFTTQMLPNGVGYMKLTSFPAGYVKLQDGKTFAEELDSALNDFEAQGVKGWILDLRNDGGGHTESISTLAGRFIPSGLQEVDVDSKGERFEVPFDGHFFPHQHPMAVLINGGSASASEITAEALKDYGVARLFGAKSAGAVNGAEIFPLPGQVGIEYTVVEVLGGKSGKPLDRVGVQPDQVVSQQSGKDAVLEAAQAWLAGSQAQPPSLPPATAGNTLQPDQLRAQLSPFEPAIGDIPPQPNLRLLGDTSLTTPGDYAVWSACTTDAAQLERAVAARGWQGEYDQFFGSGDPYTYQTSTDLYKDVAGAQQAFKANDCPQGLQSANLPVRLGDESIAFKGTGILKGWTSLRWRRGRLIFTIYYYSEPGLESFDPLVQMAKAMDTRYQAKPLK
jgi:hypothetical protein